MEKISFPSCPFAIYIIQGKLISAFQQIYLMVQFLSSIVKMMFLHLERNKLRHFQDAWLYLKYPAHIVRASWAIQIHNCFLPTVTYSSELLGPGHEDCSNLTQHFACNFFSLVKDTWKGNNLFIVFSGCFLPQNSFYPMWHLL